MKFSKKEILEYCPVPLYEAISGYLELTLLKGRQRFDAISTSNLEFV